MPYFPTIEELPTSRQVTEEFRGLNANIRISDEEMNSMKNITADYYPLLAPRHKRGYVKTLTSPGGMIEKDTLAYVDNGDLIFGEYTIPLNLTNGEKQLVAMGAYICIFPDKKYVNTADLSDYGSMDAEFTTTGDVTFSLCRADGSAYDIGVTSPTEPEAPSNGDLWLDTSADTHVLKQFSSASSMWVQIPTVYVRIGAANIGKAFEKYDGIKLSGCAYAGESETLSKQAEALNGSHVIFDKGDNYIVVIGIIDQTFTQSTAVTASRKAPDMDFVTEAQNRLWGCKYGIVDGETVNELYCCKLGDFKNWEVYQGIATDSWRGSLGSDGIFTGASTYLDNPVFFKEDCIHKVYVSTSGAHQVISTNCRGVQKGSHKSIVTVNETLYYKSRTDICAYQGSMPTGISENLGTRLYGKAVAGRLGGKYYISMYDGSAYRMFVYDTIKGLWCIEDDIQADFFATVDDELYFIDGDKKLWTVTGTAGTAENEVAWNFETGLIGCEYPENKYLSRFVLRMILPLGSTADIWIMYDSDGVWRHSGNITGNSLRSFALPVIPRRCDHLKLRMSGKGDFKLFSIARNIERGSDV